MCQLRTEPEIPANLLSYHLKVLREAGLIVGTRRGRWIDYQLTDDAMGRLHAVPRTRQPGVRLRRRPRAGAGPAVTTQARPDRTAARRWTLLGAAAAGWFGAYALNEVAWTWLYDTVSLGSTSRPGGRRCFTSSATTPSRSPCC